MPGFVPFADDTVPGVVKPDVDTTHVDGAGTVKAVQPVAAQGVQAGIRRMIDIATNAANLTATGTDDAIGDAVHVLLDLSDAILAAIRGAGTTVTIVTDTTWKAKSLWNGSSNDAPPAGWTTLAYDTSSWADAVDFGGASAGTYPPPAGAAEIWSSDPILHLGEQCIVRHVFALPAGTISAAQLEWNADDALEALYLNGSNLASSACPGGGGRALQTLAVDPALLAAGANNWFAIWGADCYGNPADIAVRLVVTYGAVGGAGSGGGTLPTGVQGDILEWLSGMWETLHIGSAGTVPTSQGDHLAYDLPTIEVDKGGAPVSREPRINFIFGAGISGSVTDNSGSQAADVSIEASGGGTLELTDGTTDVAAVEKITTTYMDVGGSTPNALLRPQIATGSQLGIVQPDNVTTHVNSGGIISAVLSGALTVLADVQYNTDLANQQPVALDTWHGIGTAVSFTVPSGTATILIMVSGTILVQGTIASGARRAGRAYAVGTRLSFDAGSGGAAPLGGTTVQIGGPWLNALAGAGVVAGTFSAGAHTAQVQVAGAVSLLATCLPASSAYQSLRILVLSTA